MHPPATTHWSLSALDPMDPDAITRRRSQIEIARSQPISDRIAYLSGLARGKRLLDVGVVDHSLHSDRSGDWLHGKLAEVASFSLGVDILPEPISRLRELGYRVECLDLTSGDRPDGRFDVIVAGEVVEHLGCPGGLFNAAADLLAEGGRFVLTTPNPFAIWRTYQHLRGDIHENLDHVTYLDAWGLTELAERSGLKLSSFRGIIARPLVGRRAQLVEWGVRHRILRLVPESVAESIVYEFVTDVAGIETT